jgi:hypothetical protein
MREVFNIAEHFAFPMCRQSEPITVAANGNVSRRKGTREKLQFAAAGVKGDRRNEWRT